MQRTGEEIVDLAVAVFGSVLAAVFAAAVGVFVAMFLGGLFFRLGLFTDEGMAWSGISLGIPIGTILAIISSVYTFRKIRRYGEPK